MQENRAFQVREMVGLSLPSPLHVRDLVDGRGERGGWKKQRLEADSALPRLAVYPSK